MLTPQVLTPVRAYPPPISDMTPQFSSYALGWSVQDYRGIKTVQHGGAVFGVLTMVVMVPDRKVGFALQMNSEDYPVLRGVMNELLDHYLGFPDRDCVAAFREWNDKRLACVVAPPHAPTAGAHRATNP